MEKSANAAARRASRPFRRGRAASKSLGGSHELPARPNLRRPLSGGISSPSARQHLAEKAKPRNATATNLPREFGGALKNVAMRRGWKSVKLKPEAAGGHHVKISITVTARLQNRPLAHESVTIASDLAHVCLIEAGHRINIRNRDGRLLKNARELICRRIARGIVNGSSARRHWPVPATARQE